MACQTDTPPRPIQAWDRVWGWVVLLGVLLWVVAVRFRLRDMPLERDEGEFAYGGQLLLQGLWPVQSLYTMKLPGTHAAYAMLMGLLGQSCSGIHLGFLAVNLASIVLLFLFTRALVSTLAAGVAAATYAVLSLSPDVLGTSAHATHFVVLFVLGGLLSLWAAAQSGRGWAYLAAGFLLSSSVLMKHNGILFLGLGSLWLAGLAVARRLSLKPAACFAAGVVAPVMLLLLVLGLTGTLDECWFWSVTYVRTYAKLNPGAILAWLMMLQRMPPVLQPAFYAALLGLTVLWFRRGAKSVALFATGWLAVSMLAVMPGWHFRPHYYIMLIPAVALLTGALVHQTTTWLARSRRIFLAAMPAVCFAAMLAWAVLAEREFFFHMDPVAACRSLYDSQPFPEARELGGFIRAHCPPAARIAVLGSEPEIYFYARRRAATGFVYTYPLLEGQPFAEQMRARMREEIAAAQPQFIVKASSWNSWLSRPAGPEKVDQLCATLLPPNYRLIAACDFLPEESRVVWHWSPEELTTRRPLAQGLLLFQRVASAEASAPQPGESPSDHAP